MTIIDRRRTAMMMMLRTLRNENERRRIHLELPSARHWVWLRRSDTLRRSRVGGGCARDPKASLVERPAGKAQGSQRWHRLLFSHCGSSTGRPASPRRPPVDPRHVLEDRCFVGVVAFAMRDVEALRVRGSDGDELLRDQRSHLRHSRRRRARSRLLQPRRHEHPRDDRCAHALARAVPPQPDRERRGCCSRAVGMRPPLAAPGDAGLPRRLRHRAGAATASTRFARALSGRALPVLLRHAAEARAGASLSVRTARGAEVPRSPARCSRRSACRCPGARTPDFFSPGVDVEMFAMERVEPSALTRQGDFLPRAFSLERPSAELQHQSAASNFLFPSCS